MKKKMFAKLRSCAGESLTETLVAMLIAVLGLVILAGAISSTNSMVQRSKTVMTTYYSANNDIEKMAEGDKTKKLSDFSVLIGGEEVSTTFDAYRNETFNERPVIAYYPQASGTSTSPVTP